MFTAFLERLAILAVALGAAFLAEHQALRIGDRRVRLAMGGVVVLTIVVLVLLVMVRPLG